MESTFPFLSVVSQEELIPVCGYAFNTSPAKEKLIFICAYLLCCENTVCIFILRKDFCKQKSKELNINNCGDCFICP